MRRSLSAALTTLLAAGFLLAGAPANAAPPAAAASKFTPIGPVRALDTRTGTGTGGATSPVGPGKVLTLDLIDFLPASATAVTLNVTAVTPSAPTYVTVFPAGTPVPTASNLNLAPGDVRANQVTVTLGAGRKISLYNNSGNVHLVADLTGYYGTNPGAGFTPLPPDRALDTRLSGGPLGPGTSRVVDLTGRIPASATAVTFNLTATDVTAATFVTAWATSEPRPNVSNLNVVAGDTRPNLVTVAVGTGRKVSLYNNAGSANLLVDVTGFYTPEYGAAFVPMNPTRVLDTRNGTGTGGTTSPVGPGTSITLDIAGEMPASSVSALLNVTGVDATAQTYVTASAPVGETPNASNLNISPGQTVANAATVAFAFLGQIAFYNNAGNVHLVADLAGVFTVVDPAPCTTDCVYAWGRGPLGTTAGVNSSPVPARVVGLSGVRAVAGGNGTGYALLADGTVRAWGENSFGQLGNGWAGGGFYTGSTVPVPVPGLTGVTAIAAGGGSAYALRTDGSVWAWGDNSSGQLGNGTYIPSDVPVRVSGLTDVVAIAAGTIPNGYALRADGTVWAWGFGFGALGDGTYNPSSNVPVRVSGLTGVTAISGGSQGGYAVRDDGTVWSWGYNGLGALGNGQPCVPNEPCVALTPVQVSGLTGVTSVAGGWENGFALRSDGTVWGWGANSYGQLGTGEDCGPNDCVTRTPVQVSTIAGATRIASRDYGAYALRSDGTVWSWGTNWDGALGTGSMAAEYSVVPVQAQLPTASTVVAGSGSGYAIVPRP